MYAEVQTTSYKINDCWLLRNTSGWRWPWTGSSYDGALYYNDLYTLLVSSSWTWPENHKSHLMVQNGRKPVQVALTRTKTMQGIFHPDMAEPVKSEPSPKLSWSQTSNAPEKEVAAGKR